MPYITDKTAGGWMKSMDLIRQTPPRSIGNLIQPLTMELNPRLASPFCRIDPTLSASNPTSHCDLPYHYKLISDTTIAVILNSRICLILVDGTKDITKSLDINFRKTLHVSKISR